MTEPAHGVYVTGCEPASGKSAVALRLQQLLARRVGRLGVFRPVVGPHADDDGLLALLRSASRVASQEGRISADAKRKVDTALSLFEASVDGDALLGRLSVARPRAVTRCCRGSTSRPTTSRAARRCGTS